MRPACANPANLRHVVRPSTVAGKTFCYQECPCGSILADGNDGCGGLHPPEHGRCGCTVTGAFCVDCDTEFTPAFYDDDVCPACIRGESA